MRSSKKGNDMILIYVPPLRVTSDTPTFPLLPFKFRDDSKFTSASPPFLYRPSMEPAKETSKRNREDLESSALNVPEYEKPAEFFRTETISETTVFSSKGMEAVKPIFHAYAPPPPTRISTATATIIFALKRWYFRFGFTISSGAGGILE